MKVWLATLLLTPGLLNNGPSQRDTPSSVKEHPC